MKNKSYPTLEETIVIARARARRTATTQYLCHEEGGYSISTKCGTRQIQGHVDGDMCQYHQGMPAPGTEEIVGRIRRRLR